MQTFIQVNGSLVTLDKMTDIGQKAILSVTKAKLSDSECLLSSLRKIPGAGKVKGKGLKAKLTGYEKHLIT